ncbi:MAG TPA: SRPBCC family protein [Chitinophagaceae bacterium]|jgi:uncharacterized protein YndB with AHSA1/START domain|nr:SRPBCC family protein [Chitinophagaceae bacterium]
METTTTPTVITVQNTINAPVAKVWEYYTTPAHIITWNTPHESWHTTRAENDLRVGGSFVSRMEAKDGSFGFDFGGIYDEVRTHELIAYTMGDGRKVSATFTSEGNATTVVVKFDAETQNSEEIQRGGWQAILDNFKKHTETN